MADSIKPELVIDVNVSRGSPGDVDRLTANLANGAAAGGFFKVTAKIPHSGKEIKRHGRQQQHDRVGN